jgi:hypothetical protein
MAGLVKNWLQIVPWEAVVSINAALCEARKALHIEQKQLDSFLTALEK